MNKLAYFLSLFMCWSCTYSSETEKFQKKRNNIVHVQENIKKIDIEEILISGSNRLYIMDEYFIVCDFQSLDKYIHLFNKEDFRYITSTAYRGEGPEEITRIGHIGIDEDNRMFYVSDHGKQRIFSFNLDSVILNPFYTPKVKVKMNETQFPDRYQYINDTLCIGLIIQPIGDNDFKPTVAKWNINTGVIQPMEYEHPKIEKKRVNFAVSIENGVYVECYYYHDLFSICSLDGQLKYNVYGKKWDRSKSNRILHYKQVLFCENKILMTYSGKENFSEERNSTIFLVYDINGDYIKTLETECKISEICYDKENNRIIMTLDDEIQFAYLDLDGIVS